MKLHHLSALLSVPFLLAALPAMADSADETKSVIVVFQKETPFHQYRTQAVSDDRETADPEGWRYLDRGVLGTTQRLEGKHRFKSTHVYSHSIKGFAAKLTKAQIEALKADPTVKSITDDGPMKADVQTVPWGINHVEADISSTKAGNGRGRVRNVHVYVIDSGIGPKSGIQSDLNLKSHISFAPGSKNFDCDDHGTHVSGTIAAMDNDLEVVGVAPGAQLHAVKTLNCEGSGERANTIKSVDWVTANAIKPAVANMSLGGDQGDPLDEAVQASADSGVFYAVSAGNDGFDACQKSPAAAGRNVDNVANGVMTVASVDDKNKEASSSNYGPCVDIWAPGVNVISTKLNGGTSSKSGTSMATPHVTGAAALYLSKNPTATARQVEEAILSHAIETNTFSKAPGTPREILLLQVDDF